MTGDMEAWTDSTGPEYGQIADCCEESEESRIFIKGCDSLVK